LKLFAQIVIKRRWYGPRRILVARHFGSTTPADCRPWHSHIFVVSSHSRRPTLSRRLFLPVRFLPSPHIVKFLPYYRRGREIAARGVWFSTKSFRLGERLWFYVCVCVCLASVTLASRQNWHSVPRVIVSCFWSWPKAWIFNSSLIYF